MCRFTLYLGPPLTLSSLITEPTNSLIHQSFHSHEREEPLNGDGFGIAWYAPELTDEPAVFRSISPAWSNGNLIQLARVTRSGCILAHVRAATRGIVVTETNCHPFSHGRFAFMHNGDVGGFQRVRRRLLEALSDETFHAIRGTTDSEHLFALFLDRYHASTESHDAPRMAVALRATIRQIVELTRGGEGADESFLNIAVADGRCAVVSHYTTDPERRADSLYVSHGKRYSCDGGVCRMLDPAQDRGAVLVSSERLSEEPGWEPVPVNHLVVVHENRTITVEPV